MKHWQRYIHSLPLLLLVLSQAAWSLQISSGPQRTLMIELFTSEGCSSCPPAEALLNHFVDDPRLWRDYIPLAFHVDYWDYLGWRDRYALPANAPRQRRYAALDHVRGVYTPAFLVNGRGWRPGWLDAAPAATRTPAGRLTATNQGGLVQVTYSGEGAASGHLLAHVALLGMGVRSDIAAGENRGRHARHDFVVLAHQQQLGAGPRWTLPLPAYTAMPADPASHRALVVWISRQDDPTPLQAAGGFLPVDEP